MKKITENLLFKVIIAIISGILLGLYLPESLGRILTTYNFLFDQFLKFLIPLIIVGLIIPSIAQLGKTAGKLLLTTVLIAYGSTLFAGLFSYTVSMSIFPSLLQNQINTDLITETTKTLSPYFTIEFPPLFDVMSALVLAFCIGIGLSKLENSALEKVFIDFEKVISFIIEKMIIPLLPFFILGIFYDMTYTGKVFTILHVFIKIIGIIFVIHILLLVIQFIIAGIASKQNPFKLLIGMLPAYFTALGTQSSAATIPVTLKQAKKLGVDEDIANFSIPLCATIHLAGSTLKIVACVLALMMMQGIAIDFVQMMGFICMLGVTMIAAPGVPGGAIMAAIGIIGSMLGFNAENQALMIALYIAMDSFGTACNVTGDGAIAIVLNAIFKKEKIDQAQEATT
ncbi:sodium:proton antiporter [Sphingobacterium faecium NBRC 15299]|jgi:Na+/H+-dicarboxylate symporter|uniref:dicarboxylate/amino acid:cation symporter n=1 Tax=Sphingobacterium faecium TaxID=34087 RepID=UPI000D3A508F|nr:dicarboxylate/amino acid:cation symporter [Sphingobacterium faecium]PTX11534.1 Na+/H+-dicarboxylate symporter [Sphingobacterium faecium]GEM64595.1 sodium:proton antiporter [Sphingobacterium faecium NBRC 15299]